MSSLPPTQVWGCGLIGTSVALGLREQGIEVFLHDRDPSVAQEAADHGAGLVGWADAPAVVVIAVPPSVTADAARAALERWPGAAVTDVASVKHAIVDSLAEHEQGHRFVGGHPMAGTERSGPSAGSAQLFAGRPWAITPSPVSSDSALQLVEEVAVMLGAVPIRMEAAGHDRAVALVSHLPHLMSVVTASRLASASSSHVALAGPGLRDVTRVAGSETGMWLDILGHNAAAVRELLMEARGDIDRLIDALQSEQIDRDTVSTVLSTGRQGRRMIPGKHGGEPSELVAITVQIPDSPGALSRLFADTGESGLNIEDLRMEHELGRPVGRVELYVAAADAEPMLQQLDDRGWSAFR